MISAPSPAEAELGRFKRAGVISAPSPAEAELGRFKRP
jgi:hypothetical protein